MNNYNKSVLPVLESTYSKFTNVEKSIADYFMHLTKDEDISSKAVSKRLFVSEASLSRFAKKLGFSGYRQFLFAFKGSPKDEKELDILTRQVLNLYQNVLEKTYALIDNTQMIRIAEMLDTYERVYVYGIGSSSVVAREFKLRFMRLGLNVDYSAESHSIKMNVTRVNEHSLVIGISVSGRTEEVIDGLRDAKGKGAKTVLLTGIKHFEYTDFVDETVIVGSLKNLAISDQISPQIPPLMVIDILYTHYLNYDIDTKKEKLMLTMQHVEYVIEK